MIFLVLTLIAIITIIILANQTIFIFLFSVSEILKLVSLKQIVNKEINAETKMPYKLTDVISRFSIYSRIIFLIIVNIIVNWILFK